MRLGLVIGLAGLAACAAAPRAAAIHAPDGPPPTPTDQAVATVAANHSGVVTAGRLGLSREGRPLHVLTIAAPAAEGQPPADGRPALLIVAGLDARHTIGTDVALALADRLAQAMIAPPPAPGGDGQQAGTAAPESAPAPPGPLAAPEVLARCTVYIVPQLNPDAAAWLAEPGRPRIDLGWAMVPDDADHDGRVDEDGPIDLNGDGVVTMMRVKNPPPGWGLEADRMIDPDEPRAMKAPDRLKGERAEYAVVVEGRDQDGDGQIAEDPPGGVDLDKNFPYRWPEFEEGAGRTPLSEPEDRALADWMLAHPNIVAVLSFDPSDNLVNLPVGGQMDPIGGVPLGVENDDRPYHEKIADAFKEITKMTGAPTADPAGSFRGWAYADFGVFSFSTPVWVRRDLIKKDEKPEEKKDEKKEGEGGVPAPADAALDAATIQSRIAEFVSATPQRQAEMRAEFDKLPAETRATIMASFPGAQPEGGAPRRGGRRGPGGRGPGGGPGGAGAGAAPKPGADSDDGKWLKYSDESRAGAGFIAWQPFNHPDLGPVEIGGFVPGFKMSPPPEELPRLADEQSRFVGKVLEKLPRLTVQPATVEPLGGGVWRIGVRLVNDGFLPTRSAIGVKSRRLPPIIVRPDLPEDAIISGERAHRVPALPGSGGSDQAEWVVRAAEGSEVKIKISSPEFGEQVVAVTLRGAGK